MANGFLVNGTDTEFTDETKQENSVYGIWRGTSSSGTCQTYSDDQELDGMWQFSRVSSTAADVVGVSAVLLMGFSRYAILVSKNFITLLCYLCSLFQCFTFVFLASDACKSNDSIGKVQDNTLVVQGECWFDNGAKNTIVGVTCWLSAGLILMMLPAWQINNDDYWDDRSNHSEPSSQDDGDKIL